MAVEDWRAAASLALELGMGLMRRGGGGGISEGCRRRIEGLMVEVDRILVSYWWLADECCEGAGRIGVSMGEAGEHEETSVGRRRPARLERARVIRRGRREEVVGKRQVEEKGREHALL